MTEPPPGPGPGYPAGWEADVAVSDGGVVHLRPIRPDDRDRLVAFHSRLSERTIYLRFFAPHPTLSERDLDRLTTVDHHDRVALVALLGEDMIGVGRYDRIDGGPDAEVAFVVDDAQQGRGIGSLLLEHLAAAARERGVQRFTADVLAENNRMVRVFKDAGYQAEYSYDSGVVELSFPIAPTEQSRAVGHERERRAESRSLERLLTPRSVAVIGASTDPGKVGHVVFANLMAYGFQGPVYPVHPRARHIGGVRAYASVLDVPDDVDIPALRAKYAAERAKRLRPEGADQYLELDGDYAEFYEVDPYTTAAERDPIAEDVDVVILGGGFAGLLAGAHLKKAGVEGMRVIEMAGDFGGVWYWNRFPGIQCDNDAYCYIPLLEELDFMPSRKFADGAEIFAHCQNIGKHFGLYDGALFSTQVRDMRWDDATRRWQISTDRGDDIRARFVVMAQGSYNRPKLPGIPGIKDFAGHVFHSARWDYDYTGGSADGGLNKLADKRVALVGTGATGIQLVPHLSRDAKQLIVFQRTPSS